MRQEPRFLFLCMSATIAALLLVGAGCATAAATVREDVPACLSPASAMTYRIDVDLVERPRADEPEWLRGIVPPRQARGKGSGVIINRNGLILTAAHVVNHADWDEKVSITVDVAGRKPATVVLDATIVAIDETFDLAVLKVDMRFPDDAVAADASELVKGMAVYNVGYPFDFGEMVGRGHVMRLHYSSPDGDPEYDDVMLVEISDGSGTSGSGVFSARTGKLLGIMKAYTFRRDGPNFPPMVVRIVIPIERVRRFLDVHKIRYRTSPPGTPVCTDR